jgi:CHAT domain-containing protein
MPRTLCPRYFRRISALAGTLLLTGCAYNMAPEKDRLEAAGRYSELARHIEGRTAGTAPRTADLVPLCVAYSKVKRYAQLFECLDRMDATIRSGDVLDVSGPSGFEVKSDVTQLPHVLRAEAYLELGDYWRAVEFGVKGSAPFPKANSLSYYSDLHMRSRALAALAIANVALGRPTEAQKNRADLENLSLGGFAGIAVKAQVRKLALARVHMALGEWDKALEASGTGSLALGGLVNAILGASAEGESIFTYLELPSLYMRTKCLLELGRLSEAKQHLDELLAKPQSRQNGELYWLMLKDRSVLAERELRLDEAIRLLREAVDVIERQRATINTEASKIGFVGDKQAVYARLIALLIAQDRAAEAFDYVERSKSRALVDMLAAKQDFAAPDPAQAMRVLAQLDAADLSARIQDDGAQAVEKTTGVRNLQVAREALQTAAPELSTLVTVSSVPSAELKALLGADETLIEYYYQGAELYAFLLDRERLQAVKLDAAGLGAQVQSLRKALEDTASAAWQEPARGLYRRLWQPLEKLVATGNVIVVAHGALHYLPFAAVQDADGKFLLDRYSLRFLPSASVLKFLRPVLQNRDGRLLVLGNPDLDDPRLDLAFAEGEAKRVAALYPTSRVLLRKDASESNFKKAGGVFSRIHFASHGKFQADEPLKSGLYLAKDADNDGVLTVGELYSMNLEADLVTLSACETGLGKIASGDDVVGLTRGFLYAGSRSIVASLWSVDDQATATLMQAFHGNLATMNKREALRQAQIKARESFPHPFFWAAFQLTGRAE